MATTKPTGGDPIRLDTDWAYKALADPIRRSLLETLGKKQYFCRVDGEKVNGVCVQDLSSLFQLQQSTVSRHLAVLRQAGLVGHQQKGIWHYYFCNIDRIRAVQRWLDSLVTEEESGADIR